MSDPDSVPTRTIDTIGTPAVVNGQIDLTPDTNRGGQDASGYFVDSLVVAAWRRLNRDVARVIRDVLDAPDHAGRRAGRPAQPSGAAAGNHTPLGWIIRTPSPDLRTRTPAMMKTLALSAALSLAATVALGQTATKLRGTITAVGQADMRVQPREGGAPVAVSLPPDAAVVGLVPARLADIAPGSFIGTAAETQADGTLVAREVHVFPESMRGAGEGHRPFDLGPKSSMTNGTVGQEVKAASGDTLTVAYKGGEKTILVPKDAPVVAFVPGDKSLLAAGAHVIVMGQAGAGASIAASRVIVGRDGLVPPM